MPNPTNCHMTFLLALVAFVAFVSAKESNKLKAAIEANAVACIQQEGITKEQAMKVHESSLKNADAKIKCFVKCFLEKFGFFVDGQHKPDVVLEKLGPTIGKVRLKAIQAKCASVTGTDKCDTAYLLYKCYYKNDIDS